MLKDRLRLPIHPCIRREDLDRLTNSQLFELQSKLSLKLIKDQLDEQAVESDYRSMGSIVLAATAYPQNQSLWKFSDGVRRVISAHTSYLSIHLVPSGEFQPSRSRARRMENLLLLLNDSQILVQQLPIFSAEHPQATVIAGTAREDLAHFASQFGFLVSKPYTHMRCPVPFFAGFPETVIDLFSDNIGDVTHAIYEYTQQLPRAINVAQRMGITLRSARINGIMQTGRL